MQLAAFLPLLYIDIDLQFSTMNASVPHQKHDADQAGGAKEVVYASDGVDVPPISFPTAQITDDNDNKKDDDGLEESEIMTAEEAFEVFAGKLYVSNPYNRKPLLQQKQQNDASASLSPLERLGRLKLELDDLEKECGGGYSSNPSSTTITESNMFQPQLLILKEHLHTLSAGQLNKVNNLSGSVDASVAALNASETAVATAATIPSIPGTSQLDDRLIRLEKLLGTGSSNSEPRGHDSLWSRVQALEQTHSCLDEKKLDLLQKRGKVIRQDLEAASKARNKLASSSNILGSSEDSKTITALYDQLQQLQGVSQHLPALTARLQALAHQHTNAATHASRLHSMEQGLGSLAQQIQSVESALSTLDASMKQNATSMQKNIYALEESVKAIPK